MNEEGVSSVVAAVLVVTLFTAAFGVWTVDTMPEWIKDREDAHARMVGATMGSATADILASATNGRPGATALSFPLAPDPIPLVQEGESVGTLETVEGFGWTFEAASHAPIMTGGIMRAAPAAQPDISNVARILALDVAGGSGTLRVEQESSAAVFVALQITPADCATDGDIQTVTVTVNGATWRRTQFTCAAAQPLNALDARFAFAAALEELQNPLVVKAGQFSAAWIDTDGVTRATATTPSATPWSSTGNGKASVRYAPSYLELEDRQVIMEGGAVINKQDAGASFTSTPPLTFGGSPSTGGAIRWTMTVFDGEGAASGRSTATANLVATSTSERIIYISSEEASFKLDKTLAPTAWTQAWADAARIAGFSVDATAGCTLASAHVCVEDEADAATLTLKSSIPWTIHLTIVHVDVSVT